MTIGGLKRWGSSVSRICTAPLVLGWVPCSMGAARNMEVAAGWRECGVNKIFSKPRAKANSLGVHESSGELMGRAHCWQVRQHVSMQQVALCLCR